MERITVFSKRMKIFTAVLIILTWVSFAFVAFYNGIGSLLPVPKKIAFDLSGASTFSLVIIYLLAAIKPAAYLPVLGYLYRLFGLYQQGIVFSAENIACIRKIGYSLMAIDLVVIIQGALTGPVLSVLGVTERYFTLSLGSSFLIVGLFIVLVSHVMEMGRELQEYNKLVI